MSDDSAAQIQQQSTIANIGYVPSETQFEQSTIVATAKPKKEKAKPKAEPIKLKIKTNARLRNNSELLELTEESEPYRVRSTRRTTPQDTATENVVEDNVPVPGTANYELYRTLTQSPANQQIDPSTQSHFTNTATASAGISPEYQLFANPKLNQTNIPVHLSVDVDAQNSNTNSDTERSILPKKRRGKNKAKFDTNTESVPEEPVQKKQRGRRKHDEPAPELTEAVPANEFVNIHTEQMIVEEVTETYPKKRITAAAKKQYKDENIFVPEHSNPLPEQQAEETYPIEEINSELVGNRRGRKAKGKANQSNAKTDQMSQPQVPQRPIRTTRHTANGNMTRVSYFKWHYFSKCLL